MLISELTTGSIHQYRLDPDQLMLWLIPRPIGLPSIIAPPPVSGHRIPITITYQKDDNRSLRDGPAINEMSQASYSSDSGGE